MAGLLDNPQDAALMKIGLGLLSAGGPSRMPVSLGQAIGGAGNQAMDEYRQTEESNYQKKIRDIQMQDYLRKQEQAKQKQVALQQLLSNPQIPQHIKEGVAAGVIDLGDLYKPQKLGEGDNLVSPIQTMMGMNGTIAQGAPKAATPTELDKLIAARDRLPMGDQNRKIYDAAITKLSTHAPGATQNVFNNTKDNFKNERDLRNDFQGLATTKAFREVQSAYDQINVALKSESAAGDLAAATKLMKILDPGSVVRESELGMAMAATGALDRLGNYATMLTTGQKLTPSQRKDFGQLAESLYSAAETRYNQSADEYRGTASSYGLNQEMVAKPAKKSSLSNGGWSATRK